MAILNVSLARKTTLLPWHIEAEHSFRDFFEDSIRPRLPSTSIESWIDLVKTEVGTSIDNRIKGLEETVCTFTCVTSRCVTRPCFALSGRVSC